MARNWTCGFELNSLTADMEIRATVGVGLTTPVGAARSGQRGLKAKKIGVAGTTYIDHSYKLVGGTIYLRVFVNIRTAFSALAEIIEVGYYIGAYTVRTSIRLNPGGTLELWDETGAAHQIGADSAALNTGTWYRIELEINQTTGAIDAHLDGTSFASGTITTTGSFNNIRLGIVSAAIGEIDFDDCAANDTSGSYENTWCGDGRITGDFAVLYDGDTRTGSRGGADSGSDSGQVDERPPNDLTDYWNFDNDGDILECITPFAHLYPQFYGTTPVVVHVGFRFQQSVAGRTGLHYLRCKSQSGGTVSESGVVVISGLTWRTNTGGTLDRAFQHTLYTDPQTGLPWVASTLATVQIGGRKYWPWGPELTKVTAYWIMVESKVLSALKDIIMGPGLVPVAR